MSSFAADKFTPQSTSSSQPKYGGAANEGTELLGVLAVVKEFKLRSYSVFLGYCTEV